VTTQATLIDAYRRAEVQVAGEAVGQSVLAFRQTLDPARLDATFAAYVIVMMQIIEALRQLAANVAGAFYASYRQLALPGAPPPSIVYAPPIEPARVTTSLLVTGPVTVKAAVARGVSLDDAVSRAEAATAGSVYRMVADAGRDTIRETVREDPEAVGWARVPDANPCYFCAMLASRGPVYLSAETATTTVSGDPYHDGCGCVAVPVFSRDDPWPGPGRYFHDLWRRSTAGKSGKDAIKAFRHALKEERKAGRGPDVPASA